MGKVDKFVRDDCHANLVVNGLDVNEVVDDAVKLQELSVVKSIQDFFSQRLVHLSFRCERSDPRTALRSSLSDLL